MFILLISLISSVTGGTVTDNAFKDQFCTDPRTMQKHAAYTEWADAYSCTRHRCQPGGRNLAIYTVGCKRVEAPESAIECEEVVEDTNMQFPYCCTRLRCLVVVRGEVWTRVLGQPWETLPAAPWSHMYKMKKPPPGDGSALPKNPSQGPIYELTETFSDGEGKDKSVRNKKKAESDYDEPKLRSSPKSPDIVIALSTDNDVKQEKKIDTNRFGHLRKAAGGTYIEDEAPDHHNDEEETQVVTEKEHQTWTDIPSNQWNDHEVAEQEAAPTKEHNEQAEKAEKPSNLQALVDAIGTRMRDIEHVVQKMSEKVHHAKPGDPDYISAEKRAHSDLETIDVKDVPAKEPKPKTPNADGDHYKRFTHDSHSKYLHSKVDTTTDQPLFVEDTNMNGYFSDASNSILRRSGSPKEPALTYMAPVENRRKGVSHSDNSEEVEKRHKKHNKHKKSKFGKNHKKHKGKDDKKSKFKSANSVEVAKNTVSMEDSSGVINK